MDSARTKSQNKRDLCVRFHNPNSQDLTCRRLLECFLPLCLEQLNERLLDLAAPEQPQPSESHST